MENDTCPMPLAIPAGPDDLGEVPTPEACCTAGAEPIAVEESCLIDCAYAACELASDALAQQAADQLADGGIGTANAAADLQFYSDQLTIPANLQLCVDQVIAGEPLDLGDGVPNTNEAGDISNMILELSCSITGTTARGDSCNETPNFEESTAGDPGEGPVVGGLVSLAGPLGSADAEVMGLEFGIRAEPCSGDVCGVVLTRLELVTDDFFLGPVQFQDVEVSLLEPATGMREGEAVTFGTLRVLMISKVSLFGQEIGQLPLVLSSRGPTSGVLTSDDMFGLVEANFKIGSQTGTLTLDPAPATFTAGS